MRTMSSVVVHKSWFARAGFSFHLLIGAHESANRQGKERHDLWRKCGASSAEPATIAWECPQICFPLDGVFFVTIREGNSVGSGRAHASDVLQSSLTVDRTQRGITHGSNQAGMLGGSSNSGLRPVEHVKEYRQGETGKRIDEPRKQD
jgi:hypothetical protein